MWKCKITRSEILLDNSTAQKIASFHFRHIQCIYQKLSNKSNMFEPSTIV